MTTVKRKSTAWTRVFNAHKALCEYRGLVYNEDDIDVKYCHSHSWTIAMILREAEKIEALLNIPIKPATEKQINYILKLAKRSKEDDRYLNKDINIYQASALIELYKEIEDCIYSRSCYSYGWLEIASDKLEAQFALLKEKA